MNKEVQGVGREKPGNWNDVSIYNPGNAKDCP